MIRAVKTFNCACGNKLYFENSQCLRCGRRLGFVPALRTLIAFERGPRDGEEGSAWHTHDRRAYGNAFRPCRNYVEHQSCNWMIPADSNAEYCVSCDLNQVIPDLTVPRRIQLWYEVEKAKRRLVYTLLALELPLEGYRQRPGGLAFQFLADARLANKEDENWTDERVSTGHHNGVITINLAEADPALREEMRESMNEAYRTLLGHFRHESGHYYWFLLFQEEQRLKQFRRLFGDERRHYGESLNAYYQNGPAPDWMTSMVSAYASSHPWEDFAETWAHYLHMVDTLETAHDCGFEIDGRRLHSPLTGSSADFDVLLDDWTALTQAMNLLNRSMGLADAYPFTYADLVVDKLRYIHEAVGHKA
jgi:hypothetical protein